MTDWFNFGFFLIWVFCGQEEESVLCQLAMEIKSKQMRVRCVYFFMVAFLREKKRLPITLDSRAEKRGPGDEQINILKIGYVSWAE
jgi:hypothetical protein